MARTLRKSFLILTSFLILSSCEHFTSSPAKPLVQAPPGYVMIEKEALAKLMEDTKTLKSQLDDCLSKQPKQ